MLVAAIWARPVLAHPHVWIGVEARVVYANGSFTGIAQTWTFDEFSSAYAIQGLDTNGDGAYDDNELAELTRRYRDATNSDGYFTIAELPGEMIRLGRPTDFRLDVKDGILSQTFTLLFGSPIPPGPRELRFAVFDPSYFIAFELGRVDFQATGGSVPSTCRIRMMMDADAGAATASPQQSLPVDFSPDLMEPFGTVSVACAAP